MGAWAAGASCLFCSIWNVLRRLTACLVAFVVSVPFGAQNAFYGLLSWVFACMRGLFCACMDAFETFPNVLHRLVQATCKQAANDLQTGCKQGENDLRTTIKQPNFIGLKSVKNSVKMRVEMHLEMQFGDAVKFLIYLKKKVFGDAF